MVLNLNMAIGGSFHLHRQLKFLKMFGLVNKYLEGIFNKSIIIWWTSHICKTYNYCILLQTNKFIFPFLK